MDFGNVQGDRSFNEKIENLDRNLKERLSQLMLYDMLYKIKQETEINEARGCKLI